MFYFRNAENLGANDENAALCGLQGFQKRVSFWLLCMIPYGCDVILKQQAYYLTYHRHISCRKLLSHTSG